MPPIDTHWAYARYQSVRHRLPPAATARHSRPIDNLAEIADEFDVFVFDAYGVLNVGDTAIDGAVERIQWLQQRGKQTYVLTNGASWGKAHALAKYRRWGFPFSLPQVISSRDALCHGLQQLDAPSARFGVIAQDDADLSELPVDYCQLRDRAEDYHHVDHFIFLSSGHWSTQRQAMLQQSLAQNPRPLWVGNPDIVAPRETDFSLEPGSFSHDLADALGIEPVFFGKPFANVFELLKRHLGDVPAQRVLMLGDTLHTDILGGAAAGFSTALVSAHGLFKGHEVEGFIEDSGIRPDYIAPSI